MKFGRNCGPENEEGTRMKRQTSLAERKRGSDERGRGRGLVHVGMRRREFAVARGSKRRERG